MDRPAMFRTRAERDARQAPIRLPTDAVRPDYGDGGLFGLVGSFAEYLDGAAWAPPGASPPADPARDRSLVFLLIDGLGDTFLQRFGRGSALLARRSGRLTSVFPSTTASAVTTTLTGLAPARHGLTGWFIRDRRFGGVIAPLPMMQRAGGPVRGVLMLPRLFPYRTLFQRRRRASVFVTPETLAHSAFTMRHARGARIAPYAGLPGMIEAVASAVSSLRGAGGFVHAYYPVFDALSHHHGSTADRVVAQFRRIDEAFAALLERLRGSACDVVVSADHGFIDSPPARQLRLDAHPGVAAMLAAPLFGERRAAFACVRPGAAGDFEAFARDALRDKAVLVASGELLDSGLLGPGKPHRRLAERIGTHALLMETGWTLCDHVPGEPRHDMLGVHGGLSPDEMWVPLIVARC